MLDISVASHKCIFRQAWWLRALCNDGEWGEVRVELESGKTAMLPYAIQKTYGFTILTMPPLTQTLGPLIPGLNSVDGHTLKLEKDLYGALIEQLPPHDAFNQNFHWSVTNWLPWYWKGFEQSTRYTYRLNNLSDHEKLWSGFMPNIKSDIKKAINRFSLRVHSDFDVDRFLDLNEMTFARQGKKVPFSRAVVKRLDHACAERGCRKIFFAEDAEGRLHAAAYIVWDECSAYYLMGGGDPALRSSGATSLVIWEAIKFSSHVTQSFDFEGSMIEPVERFFRGFGAHPTPYFHVWRFNNRFMGFAYHLLRGLKLLLGK